MASIAAQQERTDCRVSLEIVTRYDNDTLRWVAGSRELEVWSSGATPQESYIRAGEAINLFLEEAAAAGTVEQVLQEADVKIHMGQEQPTPSFPLLDRLNFFHKGFFPAIFQLPPLSLAHC